MLSGSPQHLAYSLFGLGAVSIEFLTGDRQEQVVEFDFTRPETRDRALTDVDGIFLVRPEVVDKSDVGSFVEAADNVGVAHIAYLSALGAEKNHLVPHH